MTQTVLSREILDAPEAVTMRGIAQRVADRHGVTLTELRFGVSRRNAAWPRQEAMYEMVQAGLWSLSQIGIYFGGKHHATVKAGKESHAFRAFGEVPPERRQVTRHESGPSFIVELNGSQDGIRFGVVSIRGKRHQFFHDRLNGVVRLWNIGRDNRQHAERNPGRISLAKAMLEAARAEERGVTK